MARKSFLWVLFIGLVLGSCTSDQGATDGAQGAGSSQGVGKGGTEQGLKVVPGQTGALHFAHMQMEFKDVVDGETVTAIFPFKNASNQMATIDNVQKSCYCLSVDWPKGQLVPGEEGEITVTFLTEGQAASGVPATHEKMFPVFVNGDQYPMETLRLRGRVLPKK